MTHKINLKTILSLVMAIVVMSAICFNLVGCNDSSSNSGSGSSTSKNSISESEAISLAKESSRVQDAIADKFGMEFYYTPSWGTCTATQRSDGSWEVVLKGNISGYTDDHKTNFVSEKKFTVDVTVGSSGSVGYVYVKTN